MIIMTTGFGDGEKKTFAGLDSLTGEWGSLILSVYYTGIYKKKTKKKFVYYTFKWIFFILKKSFTKMWGEKKIKIVRKPKVGVDMV